MSRRVARELWALAAAVVVVAGAGAACADVRGDAEATDAEGAPGYVRTFEDEWGRACTVWKHGYAGGIDCD